MLKKRWIVLLLFVTICAVIVGCESSNNSNSQYNSILTEQDAAATESEELKDNAISQENSYDEIETSKKDEAATRNESANNSSTVSNENSSYDSSTIEFPSVPIYLDDCGFSHYSIRIDSFEATVKEESIYKRVDYTITGVTSNVNDSAYIKVNCYDKDGYTVDQSGIRLTGALPGEPFRVKDHILVKSATVRVDFVAP